MTGVQRYADQVTRRLGDRVDLLVPSQKNWLHQGHPWEQLVLPRLLDPCHLLWSPANSGPLGVANQVITIHDLSAIEHPEWFNSLYANWQRFLLPRLARRARRVLTVSQFSKERIVDVLHIPEQKVLAIPNGVDTAFRPQSESEIRRVCTFYHLPTHYLLAVGSLEPRKNLGRLFQAWEQIARRYQEVGLVLVGASSAVFRGTGFHKAPHGAMFLGAIPERDLPAIYGGAMSLIYLSQYEGFGLPVIEAMACGTPVICSNCAALPETAGQAALLVDPHHIDSIEEALKKIIIDSQLRDEMQQAGLKQARRFNWDQTAGQIWEALLQVCDEIAL